MRTARRSVVVRRSRPSKRSFFASPGQSATTRPPRTAPPSTKAAPPVPWSVPRVPLIATSRPNSLATTTTVRRQGLSPATRPSRRAASPASSWRRAEASAPFGLAWLACVSQPPSSSTAACGPFGWARNSAARRASAANAPRGPGCMASVADAAHPGAVEMQFPGPRQRRRQRRVVAVQPFDSGHQVERRIGQGRRRPGVDRGLAAQHQRHRRVQGDGLGVAVGRARPSQPVAISKGRVPPLSSTCWASKWDRLR